MAHQKRSFFERLTGAVKLEEEEDMIVEESFKDSEGSRQGGTNGARRLPPMEEDEVGELTVDVINAPSEIIIKTMVAGVKPDDLDITITRDSVVIRGKRHEERTVSTDDYIHRELYWGSFARTINLPEEIDVEESEAIEKYGLLMLRLPKVDKHKQTKLKVKGS